VDLRGYRQRQHRERAARRVRFHLEGSGDPGDQAQRGGAQEVRRDRYSPLRPRIRSGELEADAVELDRIRVLPGLEGAPLANHGQARS
jgi:hypothetical protein